MMNLDQLNLSRTVYNILDLLGDIGGCLDALVSSGTFLVWLIAGKSLFEYLVNEISMHDEQNEPESLISKEFPKKTLERIKARKKLRQNSCTSPLNCLNKAKR